MLAHARGFFLCLFVLMRVVSSTQCNKTVVACPRLGERTYVKFTFTMPGGTKTTTATQLMYGIEYKAGIEIGLASLCSSRSTMGLARRGNGLCTHYGYNSNDYLCSGGAKISGAGEEKTQYFYIKNTNASDCTDLTAFAAMGDIGSVTKASVCNSNPEETCGIDGTLGWDGAFPLTHLSPAILLAGILVL